MRIFPAIFASLIAFFYVCNAHAAYDTAAGATQKELRIVRVTPSGEDVPAERQIVITFNRAVVPLGKMERSKEDVPVTITPAVECEWRWINTTSLACQLGEKTRLIQATKYDIVVNPGIKAEDGATIGEIYKDSFITQRPDVSYPSFHTWQSPGTPVVRLTFNQPVTKTSVEEHFYFAKDNSKIAQPVVKPDPQSRTAPSFLPFDKGWLWFGKQDERKVDDQLTEKEGVEARRVWLIEPETELPLDSEIALKLEPGLVSAVGSQAGIEKRDVITFNTYPEFSVIGIRCRTNDDVELIIKPGDSQNQLCNALAPISIAFSAPVNRSQVKNNFTFTPSLGNANVQNEIWGDASYEPSYLYNPHTKGRFYDVNLPYGLKAAQAYTVSVTGATSLWSKVLRWFDQPQTNLEDAFARKLAAPVTLSFTTDHRKPNFVLDHHEAVLEKGIDSDVPLYINNLEKTGFSYRSLTSDGVQTDQKYAKTHPEVKNVQYAVPFGVREMLQGKSGAIYGHLDTTPVVTKGSRDYRLFAVVTPYQVHVKMGHFSSIVWVTDMADGHPVKDAKIVAYKDKLSALSVPQDVLAEAVTDENGIAILPGTETLDPLLELNRGWQDGDTQMFIRVDKGSDMAVMPLHYDFMIDTWRASDENIFAANKKKFGHIQAWGTTAQGIYRAGDTIQYKFYVRNQNDRHFTPAPATGYKLEIVDPMDNVVDTIDNVTLNNFGAFAGEFKVTKEAAIGWYRFRLTAPFAGQNNGDQQDDYDDGYPREGTWYPIRVLVSDFTPAPFKLTNQLNGDLFHVDQDVEVQTDALLHSGGPYTNASGRITAILEERPFTSKNKQAAKFTFTLPEYELKGSSQIFQNISPLDNKGQLTTKFSLKNPGFAYGQLTVESAVQDERGKYIAAESSAEYVGVDRFVGMRSPEWAYAAKKPVNLEYLVTDERGELSKGTKVSIVVERLDTTAARVKGAGNAYLTNYNKTWEKVDTCKGISTADVKTCTFTPSQAGSYRAIAKISDSQDRVHSSGIEFWVTGKDYVVWDTTSDVLLPILPEKSVYRVGDTARYLIKNPYPSAKALITVERYGVIDTFVQTLEGSTPTIELKIKPDYLPGFYLSVLVVSPRVDKPLGDGQVDLGKPTFRMGYVTVPVKDKYKEMTVTAKAEQDTYRPRDKVNVTLHAKPVVNDKKEPIELAVAVLDESVFDLVTGGEAHFDPYDGFYKLDGLDLRNYSLLTRLIGRQKFEKKGANPGGDGGADLKMRDAFKFVAYWNPSLKTDDDGYAQISFDAPDNLTGWRVLALGVTPSDRMGLGQANFKVNRPTEVRPVMPNQVTERDRFMAGFSVMNRTDKARELTIKIAASGPIDTATTPASHEETITLEPYKRTTVYMPIQTAALSEASDAQQEQITFDVRAADDQDGDGMVHLLPVNKMRSLETAANYGTTTQDKVVESIQFPNNVHADIGNVSVVLAPSVIGAVEGAFTYMKNYPYICWEQILTKGVMASHYQNLKQYMPDSFEWKGSDKLSQDALDVAANFQAANGGMSYFRASDEYADPYLSAYTALSFNWLRQAGYKIPETVEKKLHGYLLNFLKNDVQPTFYDAGMSSTVRAVALAALAENGKITKNDLDRYATHTKQMSLFGKTHFLQAALKVDGAMGMAHDVTDLILAASNQTGGKFIFNETLDDSYQRILASPLRENCAILDTFVTYGETKEGGELVGDIPFKLVRTITQTRQNRDHWENTQENMFCLKALVEYSKAYEGVQPAMSVKASLNDTAFGETAFKDVRDLPVTLERKIQPADVGSKATLSLEKEGEGRLYYATRLRYAPKADVSKPVNSGIEVRREYSVEKDGKWQLLDNKDKMKRGDLVRIDLYLSLPAARNFVAVNDPVPGGLEPVNRDLATTSKVDADKAVFAAADGSWFFRFGDWQDYNVSRWSFYHQEIRHDSVRFYADYLPPGNYHLSYAAQAIADGQFAAMPTLAEEMYDPDVYGKDVSREFNVETP